MARYLFVGERPSPRALAIGATWRNGQLSGKTLHDALRFAGIDPQHQRFLNLLDCDERVKRHQLYRVRKAIDGGLVVVAMGKKVHRALALANVRHLVLVHPAARGQIRLRRTYFIHVTRILKGER